jgi:cyclase
MKSIKMGALFLLVTFNMQCQKREVEIKTTKLTEQFYMLKGSGGNIGLFIGADGVFMIDDQFAPLTSKILSAIKKITDKPVTYLINTHWHVDHTGGNKNISSSTCE